MKDNQVTLDKIKKDLKAIIEEVIDRINPEKELPRYESVRDLIIYKIRQYEFK